MYTGNIQLSSLDESLKSANNFELDEDLNNCINLVNETSDSYSEQEKELFNYVINNIERDESGRIIAPALWDWDNEHLLAKNLNISKSILYSTLKKLNKRPEALAQYNDVIQEQIGDGIIEEISNLEEFLEQNPDASFLPHSAVIRESSSTTKCRVVFLSNLCERARGGMSHNQVSFPGANLNSSLFTSLLLLRFDKYLLTFDLCKAFLQIKLRPSDSVKLLFLWFRDVKSNNYELVAYRFLRLGFGLRFSPSILMSVLYFILMINIDRYDEELKAIAKRFYALLYMDNVSYTSASEGNIVRAYHKSYEIFNAYGFDLQKFLTNVQNVQNIEDVAHGEVTPPIVDLLGVQWNRLNDQIMCRKLNLNPEADTKRKVLQSLNSQYDPIGVHLPLLNRAKFFLHSLQIDNNLGWDDYVGSENNKEWVRICKQANAHEPFPIDRCIGSRS
ncbi:MAG: hypothetical protein AAGK97_13650, partial [Bacteroidota bacterium]